MDINRPFWNAQTMNNPVLKKLFGKPLLRNPLFWGGVVVCLFVEGRFGHLFTAIFCIALVPLYLFPCYKARSRKHPNTMAIAVLNILLGWTILGWVASLVWALTAFSSQAATTNNEGEIATFFSRMTKVAIALVCLIALAFSCGRYNLNKSANDLRVKTIMASYHCSRIDAQLMDAESSHNFAEAKNAIANGADVTLRFADGVTGLMDASCNGGNFEIANLLVEHGADVNAQDARGWTALIDASSGGYTEIVKLLLEHGADVSIQGGDGRTALDWAISQNHFDVVDLLTRRHDRGTGVAGSLNSSPYFIVVEKDSSITILGYFGAPNLPSGGLIIPNTINGGKVTSIGVGAFEDCAGMTSVTIPDSVTRIGKKAFYHCTGLTSVAIPIGVTSIGDSAFEGCSSLVSLTIPHSVTSIGNAAFEGCTNLLVRAHKTR